MTVETSNGAGTWAIGGVVTGGEVEFRYHRTVVRRHLDHLVVHDVRVGYKRL